MHYLHHIFNKFKSILTYWKVTSSSKSNACSNMKS